jgi:hypothetical protein
MMVVGGRLARAEHALGRCVPGGCLPLRRGVPPSWSGAILGNTPAFELTYMMFKWGFPFFTDGRSSSFGDKTITPMLTGGALPTDSSSFVSRAVPGSSAASVFAYLPGQLFHREAARGPGDGAFVGNISTVVSR